MSAASYLMLDVETPGVSPRPQDRAFDRILEVAVIIADREFNELARFETVVKPRPQDIERLHAEAFVLDMHKQSGLYDVLVGVDAGELPTMEDAEASVLDLISQFVGEGESLCISGSGVARFDHPILEVQMPRLAERLFYFEQDPSSARRLYKGATGMDIVPPKPSKTHRAMADIEDDIRHLKQFVEVYRQHARSRAGYSVDPASRALTSVSLTEAFMNHDSFHNADGDEIATTDTGSIVKELLQGMSALDIAAGYMDTTERLVQQVAELRGIPASDVLREVREGVVARTT